MSAAHTPGPWHLEVAEDDSGRIKHLVPADSEKQSLLTTVEWEGVKFAAVFADEDAHLIAAAPDLLEALKLADAMLSGANMNVAVVQAKVHAAIAKATGAQA